MRDIITEIWSTARRNKLRTALTGFAVAWGIFMLIVLLGAGNGLINASMNNNSRFIANSMAIFGGTTSKPYKGLKEGRYVPLKDKDITTTETQFTENIDEVGARLSQPATTISLGENYVSTTLNGVYPNHEQTDKMEMRYGRFINHIDMKEKRKVLVLGDKQAEELTHNVESLVGKYLKVGAFAFRVVGIYKEKQNSSASAYTAYTTLQTVYGKSNQPERIVFTFHGLNTEKANEDFEKEYRAKLNTAHQADPEDESALWIWNRYTQNLQMETGMGIIRTALWIVGLFTLLSGIVGVSNIMLITVKERTREFGIRKAIGAKPWSILKLIIVESVIITTFFGYIGMVLGVAANEYMDATLGHDVIDTGLFKTTMFVNPTVGLDVCIEATMVMVIAGTLAGLVPALKASRIRPIEALRAE
jgi:putative ABC transport system permease protein